MLKIPQAVADQFAGTLAQQVAVFADALEAHRFTVEVPAPTAAPLVERIVRQYGG